MKNIGKINEANNADWQDNEGDKMKKLKGI